MGGQVSAQGTPKTPLQCVLDNLTALSDPGCKNKRSKLIKLSQKVWPLCHVGPVSWPKDGSISVPLRELEKYLWLNGREKELPYLYLFFLIWHLIWRSVREGGSYLRICLGWESWPH